MDTRVAWLAAVWGDRLPLRRPGHRPFFPLEMAGPFVLEGEPGTCKTALAEAIAEALERPLIRLQCYEGIDATQALYDWDFPRQILHRWFFSVSGGGGGDVAEAEKSLYDERFLLARPVLAALQQSPAVLLVDQVYRADDEFEAFLLQAPTYQATIPSSTSAQARTPPWCSTSNRTLASSTTPSSGAASTTGSTTPASSGRWPSSGPVGAGGQRRAGPAGRRGGPAAAPGLQPAQAARRRRELLLARRSAPRHRRARRGHGSARRRRRRSATMRRRGPAPTRTPAR